MSTTNNTTTPQFSVFKTKRGFVIEPEGFDGESEDAVLLPTKMEVCGRCRGRGKHDHPAFSNGITQSEWASDDWDDDSRQAYMRGDYHVACEECHRNNVVEIPDEERMTPEQIAALHRYYADERSYRAEIESERRMGA